MFSARIPPREVPLPAAAILALAAGLLAAAAAAQTAPTYVNYPAPGGLGTNAGEPSIGVDARTGKVMFLAGLQTLEVAFDPVTGAASWADKSFALTSLVTFDPILFTDRTLGRTFVSQLLPAKESLMAFSDDDGASWTPSQGSGINSGVDHQTIGGGPFPRGLLGPLTSYQHAVYYCSQDIADASCAVSVTGGLTFGPAVPIYNVTQCTGLHGHVKVAPDGTVYVPNRSCGSQQGLVASADAGVTWTVHQVPGSLPSASDPSVAVASDGTVYFGGADADTHPFVAVSHDRGATWQHKQDVGAAFGIQNVAFPAIVAGDATRAAFAFLGTPTPGNGGGDDPSFPAAWHLYVAHTYDGGQTWVTVDATPNDPVQRGTICLGGTSCGSTRNLLDFLDATIDTEGRVLVGYADGCVGACVQGPPSSFSALATIARQSGGQRLYAAFDH
jgi:hypothetical protein